MISQLHGTLVESTMSSAVVDVSGVGFELGISGSTAATLPTPAARSVSTRVCRCARTP